ncbi:hypothetical protein [Salinivibrio sp. SS2]|uniref:hypothetical protein n=1 Tax=Salinivibrio sp. SS2 TaxID=1892894 RepID=UPI00084C3C30|nr:hypothetical protein [Salinivibrio sp. DV]ODP99260.1 hypothetical protein BGK46_10870 [Salinivibrio sp. DV]
MAYRNITLKEISTILGVPILGNDHIINSLNLINRELLGSNLTYVGHENYIPYINREEVTAVLLTKETYDVIDSDIKSKKSFFIVDNPEDEFYSLHKYLLEKTEFYNDSQETVYGDNLNIHPTAVVEEGVIIKNNVTIGPHAVIHKGSIIGNNVVIHSGARIGNQGFQVIYCGAVPHLIQHVGGVKIHDDVSIGANSCIANSLFDGYTEIGKSTKIDALVFIAHNCKVGKNCVITPGVVMAGSSLVDDGVWLAPNSVVLNGVEVGDNSLVCSHSLVMKDVPSNTKVIGMPARKVGKIESK